MPALFVVEYISSYGAKLKLLNQVRRQYNELGMVETDSQDHFGISSTALAVTLTPQTFDGEPRPGVLRKERGGRNGDGASSSGEEGTGGGRKESGRKGTFYLFRKSRMSPLAVPLWPSRRRRSDLLAQLGVD